MTLTPTDDRKFGKEKTKMFSSDWKPMLNQSCMNKLPRFQFWKHDPASCHHKRVYKNNENNN